MEVEFLWGNNRLFSRDPLFNPDWILSQFKKEQKKAANFYQAFVLSGIKTDSPFQVIKGQLFLGQDHFIEQIKHLMRGKEKLKEITREQRYAVRPLLNEILPQQDKKIKNQAMDQAHLKYGYTLKDIAEYLGMLYSTVSGVMKRIEREDEK